MLDVNEGDFVDGSNSINEMVRQSLPGETLAPVDLTKRISLPLGLAIALYETFVRTIAQTLTEEQKAQARENIDAADGGIYSDSGIYIGKNNNETPLTGQVFYMSSLPPDDVPVDCRAYGGSLFYGIGYAAARSGVFHIGSYISVSNNIKQRCPWLVPYLSSASRMYTYTDGKGVNFGPNVIDSQRNVQTFCFGSQNLVKPKNAYIAFVSGERNYAHGGRTYIFGNDIKAERDNEQASFSVGMCHDVSEDDVFTVGNGTVDGAARNPSVAFRVKNNGDCIAKRSFAIEDGQGGVVELNAAKLQQLLDLLPNS